MLFDKGRQKEPTKPPVHNSTPHASTSNEHLQHNQQKHNDPDKDLDHFASMLFNTDFDFDFNKAAEHAEKSFDPLKFLMKEINGGPTRDSPEPAFSQAELEPVQVNIRNRLLGFYFYTSVYSTGLSATSSIKNRQYSVNKQCNG